VGTLRIVVPPLRTRSQDVCAMLEYFGRAEARELGQDRVTFSARAVDKLEIYSWPGNVAELRDLVETPVPPEAPRPGRGRRRGTRAATVLERIPLEQLSFEEMVRHKIDGLLKRMEGYPLEDLYEEVLSRVERPFWHWFLNARAAIS